MTRPGALLGGIAAMAGAVFLLAMTAVIVYIAQRLGIVANLISTLKALELKQVFGGGSGGEGSTSSTSSKS